MTEHDMKTTCPVCKGYSRVSCPMCGGSGLDGAGRGCTICKGKRAIECPRCSGTARIRSGGDDHYITVEGHDAAEVEKVVLAMMEKAGITRKKVRSNPWVSGSFYLAVFVTALATLLVLAKMVPIISLPIILICAIITLSVIGAFQLRHDDQLSQRNFFQLMALSFKYLPWIHRTSVENIDNETKIDDRTHEGI